MKGRALEAVNAGGTVVSGGRYGRGYVVVPGDVMVFVGRYGEIRYSLGKERRERGERKKGGIIDSQADRHGQD